MTKRLKQLRKIYRSDKSLADIAEELGVKIHSAKVYAHSCNLPYYGKKSGGGPKLSWYRHLFNGENSAKYIAKITCTDQSQVRTYAAYHNLKLKLTMKRCDLAQYKHLFNGEYTMKEIKEESGAVRTTIVNYAKENNLSIKNVKAAKNISLDEYAHLFDGSKSAKEIAEKTGIKASTIYKHALRKGLKLRRVNKT